MIEHEAHGIEVMAGAGAGAGSGAGAIPGPDAAPTPAPEPAPGPGAPGNPRWFTRLGLAIVHPRWALTIAADRDHTGRAESDLIAAFGLLLAATQLRGLAAAVWLGSAISPGLGVRAAMSVIAGAIKVDLVLLLLGALVVFGLAGARRNLGRAFDLASVAALPLVFVDLGATVVVRATGIVAVPGAVGSLLSGLSYGWMGALIVLAVRPARRAPVRVPALPAGTLRLARRFGGGVAAVAALGIVTQIVWIAGNLDLVKPMKTGDQAPALTLARIGPTGALGAPVTLASLRGKVTVLDFWATWCNPCVVSMPRLERLARSHPEVVVLAINLDDPAAARALFDERGYTKMTLLADDGDVSQRYGVSLIPHTVVIDRGGAVRDVVRGTSTDLAAIVEAAGTSD